MLDPILSLSFAMHSNRGVYAMLLGSGVSRAASILTGWEVVLDLVRKLAFTMDENAEPDPNEWYRQKFGVSPGYSSILAALAQTPSERQHLLREYFEPSQDDDTAKRPTRAHRAIAAMVKSGHIRVLLTTNFDRLIEQSLETLGINPTVVSTADAIDGALPLVHSPCTVIKLHGDYLDARTKNTPAELASYDDRLNCLLDRIFDEYGLVVCGWSADWDEALRSALERCKGRRFSTYWAQRGPPSDSATRLIALRAASVIQIDDADAFFVDLHQKVLSLEAFDSPHPQSAKVAAATLKRLLSDKNRYIELSDFVSTEVERVMSATSDQKMQPFVPNDALRTLKVYESHCEVLREIFAVGCGWANEWQHPMWSDAIERLANRQLAGRYELQCKMRRYPALLALYCGGIAALAKRNSLMLGTLLVRSGIQLSVNQAILVPAFKALYPQAILDSSAGNTVLEYHPPRRTPFSDHIHDTIRNSLRSILTDDERFTQMFDRFELIIALLTVDQELADSGTAHWAPLGCFSWRNRHGGPSPSIAMLRSELSDGGEARQLVNSGLFESKERLLAALDAVEKLAGSDY